MAPAAMSLAARPMAAETAEKRVLAYGDGLAYTPLEYAELLAKLAGSGFESDSYSQGGIVELLEKRMAAILGKEMAVFLPSGTLANHLAVRLLAGDRRRVLVQAESHLYNDSGDCAQTLSGLHLVPLGPGKASFTMDDVESALSASRLGRVSTPIGAVQIETPVRRRSGEVFPHAVMTKVADWARSRQIGLHLDGARLFIEAAYTGRAVKETAALFDTVYVSLYKYFNAAGGAILAGPKMLLEGLYHTRRMFGGGLNQAWPMAAVALHHLDTFEQAFAAARKTSEEVISVLSGDGNFAVERVANGTNIFRLKAPSVNAPIYQVRLEEAGISARTPAQDWFSLQVNATWSRLPAGEIVARFRKALG